MIAPAALPVPAPAPAPADRPSRPDPARPAKGEDFAARVGAAVADAERADAAERPDPVAGRGAKEQETSEDPAGEERTEAEAPDASGPADLAGALVVVAPPAPVLTMTPTTTTDATTGALDPALTATADAALAPAPSAEAPAAPLPAEVAAAVDTTASATDPALAGAEIVASAPAPETPVGPTPTTQAAVDAWAADAADVTDQSVTPDAAGAETGADADAGADAEPQPGTDGGAAPTTQPTSTTDVDGPSAPTTTTTTTPLAGGRATATVTTAATAIPGQARATDPVALGNGAEAWRQVSANAEVQRASENQSVTVRVTPDNLGPIEVQAQLSKGQLDVRLHAEAAGARAAIDRSLPSLRAELEAAGVVTGALEARQRALTTVDAGNAAREAGRDPGRQPGTGPGLDAGSGGDTRQGRQPSTGTTTASPDRATTASANEATVAATIESAPARADDGAHADARLDVHA